MRHTRQSAARRLRIGWIWLAMVAGAASACGSGGGPPPNPEVTPENAATREFSPSSDCAFCHPRQFAEWSSSPHAYSGVSPTFYSLVQAGQNGGAALGVTTEQGTALGGAVGNFCLPCHAPFAFLGPQGRYGGNNDGFSAVEPVIPFVCSNDPSIACTQQTSMEDCGAPGQCVTFEGRTCVNMPSITPGIDFPRRLVQCSDDADCAGGVNGCPDGQDCGPCIIGPTTAYYGTLQQEGINCEVCHNTLPNHRRSCQLFRQSESVGVLSLDLAERDTPDGRRLRLGPYPIVSTDAGQGRANDMLPPVVNAFHESARVVTPLTAPYDQTDRAFGVPNPANTNPHVLSPTELSCEELPYCRGGLCEGGPRLGLACSADVDCGGCGPDRTCGATSPRAGQACLTSVDCGLPARPSANLLDRGIGDGTVSVLAARRVAGARQLDRPDGNYYRSSMFCGACHDVRPPQANPILRSCELQHTHVCSTDSDCEGLNIGCPGNDCGPCVIETNTSPAIGTPLGDPRNTGVRRVENLFSEWQISLYNHPELTFCQLNSFRACSSDADCGVEGPCDVRSPYGQVVTCQDCHMSNFPGTPLIRGDGTVVPKNDLYAQDLAALEGTQSDPTTPLPERRVSTHFMAGVDLPLIPYPGQAAQALKRQEIVDASFKITLDETPATARAGEDFEVEVTIENVGVGHRVPAGFSHERQYWVQMYVQDADALGDRDPFDPAAPCNLQRTIAVGADDRRDTAGARALEEAGCVYRSGFILDKAHPETGETEPDGSFHDEDPEDFFVVAGTRVRGLPGEPRVEVRPGAEGRALTVQNICAEATEEAYREAIRGGSGIDLGTTPGFPFQARMCDASLSPPLPGEDIGFTSPGFGNPDCMEGGEDLGPCVPEIELSDGNERGRCANDLTRPLCQDDADCGEAGPCLYRCAGFPELECCDPNGNPECAAFYRSIGQSPDEACFIEPSICIGGPRSGRGCSQSSDCPESNNCGNVGPCNVENRGIVNFQNAFRQTSNGVCVDRNNPRDAQRIPIPIAGNETTILPCLLNLTCALAGLGPDAVCLIDGQCAGGPNAGEPCTNVTYRDDCPGAAPTDEPFACNVETNLELNGRPSESVFIQNHPFNFNSLPPFQPRSFDYDFEVPESFEGRRLVVAARIQNRHFPMRFLRNLIGSQVVRPPFIQEARGNPDDPDQCSDPRTIDIDCFVRPLTILGNAEPGGFVPAEQRTRTTIVTVAE